MKSELDKSLDEALREIEEAEISSKSNDLEEFYKELEQEFRK